MYIVNSIYNRINHLFYKQIHLQAHTTNIITETETNTLFVYVHVLRIFSVLCMFFVCLVLKWNWISRQIHTERNNERDRGTVISAYVVNETKDKTNSGKCYSILSFSPSVAALTVSTLSPFFGSINYFTLLSSAHKVTFTIVALHHTSGNLFGCSISQRGLQFVLGREKSMLIVTQLYHHFLKHLHSYTHTISCYTSRYQIRQCYCISLEIFLHIYTIHTL